MFTLFNTSTPKLFAEIDRVRAQMFHVPAERVFQTLEVYLGSTFINDFNFLNRTFRVTAQAMGGYRQNAASIAGLLLTTECMVTEIPEKEKTPPMPPHGGGGDMY